MPTYEYQCLDCGYKVDYFQWMTEAPKTECPTCKGRLQRLVTSGAGLIFKGSGFYITDYKNKGRSFSDGNGKNSVKTESKEPKKEKTDKSRTEAD